MNLVFWGTYDLGKPRNRILLQALERAGIRVTQIHAPVWRGVEDKSQIRSARRRAAFLWRWLAAYPSLLYRYVRAPRHDAVMVGYLGQFDVLVLAPLARLRGVPLVWDMFVPLHGTIVGDRRLVGRNHPVAWLLWLWEWLACRAATLVLMDTEAHRAAIQRTYRLPDRKTAAVFVGAEADRFPEAPAVRRDPGGVVQGVKILFYGQFIPLHGIETIVEAARASAGRGWRWTLIGKGQEEGRIRAMVEGDAGLPIEWIPWVPYERLHRHIADADVCLGIFGRSEKAASVIPNKVFQILAIGRPLVTRDSPAIRELIPDGTPGVALVPPSSPDAIVAAIERLASEGFPSPAASVREASSLDRIARDLAAAIRRAGRP